MLDWNIYAVCIRHIRYFRFCMWSCANHLWNIDPFLYIFYKNILVTFCVRYSQFCLNYGFMVPIHDIFYNFECFLSIWCDGIASRVPLAYLLFNPEHCVAYILRLGGWIIGNSVLLSQTDSGKKPYHLKKCVSLIFVCVIIYCKLWMNY